MLAKILNHLIQQALTHPSRTFMRKLQNGLYIFIRWQEPIFTMTLSRELSDPSMIELKTCISNLPNYIDKPTTTEAAKSQYNNRPSLRIDFARAELIQLTFE